MIDHLRAQAAQASAGHDMHVRCFADATSVCDNLHEFIRDYDIILVKGSRVARLEVVVDKLRELYPQSVSRELSYEVREAR